MDKIKVFATADLGKQFEGKEEFSLQQIKGVRHATGELNLLETIQYILKEEKGDFFVLCRDNHQFATHYSVALLYKAIRDAQKVNADLVCGGVSWLRGGVVSSANIFWVEAFSGLQFIIIFSSLYDKISAAGSFDDISRLTDRKFVIHPFISVQAEFDNASGTIDLLKEVRKNYI